MKTAVIGFSGSGKSETFAALAGTGALGAGRAMVKVPEPRLDPLVKLFAPKKVTYSEIEYLDVHGGGGKGSGLGERILNEIRPYDCFLAVLDAFSGLADPAGQQRAVEEDFLIADLSVIEKRLERIASDKRKSRDLVDAREEEALVAAKALLDAEKPLRADPALCAEPRLKGFRFLSAKPVLYVWNCSEAEIGSLALPGGEPGAAHVAFAAKLERELAEIPDPAERAALLAELGIKAPALEQVIAKTYALLGLISFLTAGDKEVRSWAVRRGSTAVEAAGAIHSDIQKGFILADVVGYADFLTAGDFKRAKELGLARLEGKDYLVQDGDIIEFRFNV